MKAISLAALAAFGLATAPARAEDPPKLATAGAVTPSVGADITGIPNLFDTEFANARLSFNAAKTSGTISIAPFLWPRLYHPWISETRLGALVEDSGSFALGLSWGYSQARARLNDRPLNLAGTTSPKTDDRLDRELLAAMMTLCDQIATCGTTGSPNCSPGTLTSVKTPCAEGEENWR